MKFRQVTMYFWGNRCPVIPFPEYDSGAVSHYGSKWLVRIYEHGGISARLIKADVDVDEKKVEKSYDRYRKAAGGR